MNKNHNLFLRHNLKRVQLYKSFSL